MLEFSNISVAYGRHTVLDNVSGHAPEGGMLALTGPSGSGKTTLLNCLGTLHRPDAGQILVDGRDLLRFSRRELRRFRRDHLGFLFQNYALVPEASVRANLTMAMTSAPLKRIDSRAIAAALEDVGLGGREKEIVAHLSGGEQQRLALARLLVRAPSLILADEPSGALDADNEAMVLETLRSMADSGATVVIATHSPAVRSACDAQLSLG